MNLKTNALMRLVALRFMKKLSITILFFLLAFCQINAQQAKYVFYFIGDGMGVNQVQGTELYLGELEGKIGITPLHGFL
jgi:alkaline phosphatase